MGELIHKLGIDWRLLIANTITFFIVLWVLRRYAFHPILKVLDERRSMAAKTVEDKNAAAEALAGADAEQKEIVSQARREAGKMLVEARAEAETIKHRLVTEAQAEAAMVMATMRADMKREQQAALNEARRTISGLVVEAAGKLVDVKAGKAFDAAAAKEVIQHVEQRS